jgi:hypothetical protein
MSHNPIVKQMNLGWKRSTVENGTVAVLYKNQVFVREASAGEKVSSAQVHLVDVAPQTLVRRIELPANDQNDLFACTLTLRYAVADPKRMVEDRVTDTEALLVGVLVQKLRRETCKYRLNQYKKLEGILEELLADLDLSSLCGLRFTAAPDLVFDLSGPALARIKELDRLELPQTASLAGEIPSKELAYNFQVTANVQYQVADQGKMPYDSPAEASQHLWPRLQSLLCPASRQFVVVQIAQAEAAMQDAVNALADKVVDYLGLKVLSVVINADLDGAGRQRYAELARIESQAEIDSAKLAGLQTSTAALQDFLRPGPLPALGAAWLRGEIGTTDLIRQVKEIADQNQALRLKILETLRGDDARNEEVDAELATDLLRVIISDLKTTPRTREPTLGATEPTAQLGGEKPVRSDAP